MFLHRFAMGLRAALRPQTRGQALVETALLLPIILILLLGAIDFGRLFFGWANIHQAVRIGANFAATHAGMTPDERTRYEDLVLADVAAINCDLDANGDGVVDGADVENPVYTTSDGAPVADPIVGDFATVTMECDFSPITPLGAIFFGDPIAMSASSTFPIRLGCVNCPTPLPVTPPPAPLQCRVVPDVEGMSVAGARLAWAAAGFDPANFSPVTGRDVETVDSFTVTEDDPLSTCDFPTLAIFSSDIIVQTLPINPDPPTPPCITVPNLIGTLVGDAEDSWTDAGFDPDTLTADGVDPSSVAPNRVITSQVTTPTSTIGVGCLDPTATVNVVTGAPLPVPPPLPCRVPNLINLRRAEGLAEWIDEGFSSANYAPTTGNFKIGTQSLVGGTYVPCSASIVVSAGGGPGGGGG